LHDLIKVLGQATKGKKFHQDITQNVCLTIISFQVIAVWYNVLQVICQLRLRYSTSQISMFEDLVTLSKYLELLLTKVCIFFNLLLNYLFVNLQSTVANSKLIFAGSCLIVMSINNALACSYH